MYHTQKKGKCDQSIIIEQKVKTLERARTWSHNYKTLTGQGYSNVQCLTIRLSHVTITTEMLDFFYIFFI